MPPLEPPDSHHLNAAIGWLGLGSLADARAELQNISAVHQRHPDVLEIQWALLAHDEDWAAALEIALKLILRDPDRPSGWLNRAYAVRRTPEGGLAQAWDALLPAAAKFPKELTIAYNLSCYACQLQKLDLAREWFRKALRNGVSEHIKNMALVDADLTALWDEIPGM